jgi:hypothetical protein
VPDAEMLFKRLRHRFIVCHVAFSLAWGLVHGWEAVLIFGVLGVVGTILGFWLWVKFFRGPVWYRLLQIGCYLVTALQLASYPVYV